MIKILYYSSFLSLLDLSFFFQNRFLLNLNNKKWQPTSIRSQSPCTPSIKSSNLELARMQENQVERNRKYEQCLDSYLE